MAEEPNKTSTPEQQAHTLGAWIGRELGQGPGPARIAAQRLRLARLEQPEARLAPFTRGRLAWLVATGGGLCAIALVALVMAERTGARHEGLALTPRGVGLSAEPPRGVDGEPGVAHDGRQGVAEQNTNTWNIPTRDGGRTSVYAQQVIDASGAMVELRAGMASSLRLQQGARARVEATDEAGLTLALERGTLDGTLRRTPQGAAEGARVQAGPYQIRAEDASSFVLTWQPEAQALRLRVSAGTVQVHNPLEAAPTQTLSAGQQLSVKSRWVQKNTRTIGAGAQTAHPSEVDERTRADAVNRSPINETGADVLRSVRERNVLRSDEQDVEALKMEEQAWLQELSGDGEALTPPSDEPSVIADAQWRQHALQGQYEAAVREARRVGFDTLAAEASASDLLLLADAARLGGGVEDARRVLLTLRARYASHPNAAVAAFTLGRMAQESERDDRAAIQWYRTYLRQEPAGRLAEGARARLLKAELRVGSHQHAKAAAREYLAHHPEGSSASVARSVLSK